MRLAGKVGRFDAVHNASPDLLGVPDLLEEARVLVDALDAESLVLGANGVDQVVVRDLGARNLALDLRVVCRARQSKSKRTELTRPHCTALAQGKDGLGVLRFLPTHR